MAVYLPEGRNTASAYITTEKALFNALVQKDILEGKALKCDNEHNLIVSVGNFTGIIPREEAALGVKEGHVREIAIISRVNKTVAFRIERIDRKNGAPVPILKRASLQEECLNYLSDTLTPGDIVKATVTHLEPFGAFVDIGCGVTSLISIDNISVSRISHPKDRFYVGQHIYAVVKENDLPTRRFTLSHKELLGTWEENANLFCPGQTVRGIIRSVEPYGAFVELAPNLAGLAESIEGLRCGNTAAVYIKSIIPEKMKIKLNIIDTGERESSPAPLSYFITKGNIQEWIYSTPQSPKQIKTLFT